MTRDSWSQPVGLVAATPRPVVRHARVSPTVDLWHGVFLSKTKLPRSSESVTPSTVLWPGWSALLGDSWASVQ